MKLTIESMTYGADGLAHADNGKAVFVQGAVAGDIVEAEVVQDGKSFMRARTTEILEPSPDRIQPPCPFVGICGGCSWGNLSRTAQLAAKEQNLRSTLERIGKFAPEQVDELVQPICHTKDDWGYRNKNRARTDRRQRSRAPWHARCRPQQNRDRRYVSAVR